MVKMLARTYKFRLYPNTEQERILERWLNTCRILYNNLLAERREQWKEHKNSIN